MKLKGLNNLNKLLFDGIDLAAEAAAGTVERDAEGVPVAWRLLKPGANELSRGGQKAMLNVSPEDIDAIIDYHQEKGVKIPLDSRHFLYHLASKLGRDESDILNLLPTGTGTFGYAGLEKRADGLWLSDVEYVPLARELMKEEIFRYFSPALRGMLDGRLRVTSVAMENEPSINNLDSLAAAAEQPDPFAGDVVALAAEIDKIANNQQPQTTGRKTMKKLFAALTGLLGMDSIALGAENDVDQTVIDKIDNLKQELPGLRVAVVTVGKVRDALALAADADESTVLGALKGLAAKGEAHDGLKAQVDALALAAENDKRDKLIDQGLAEGKLTNAQVNDWIKAEKVDSVALAAYLKNAPVSIQLGEINRDGLQPAGDSVALTAEDKVYCKQMGYDEAEYLKIKKGE